MDSDTKAVLTDTLIREAVGMVVLLGLLWAVGPGKVWLEALAHKAREMRAERDPHGAAVARFATEVSRWEHEQASGPDSPPAGFSPCGCN